MDPKTSPEPPTTIALEPAFTVSLPSRGRTFLVESIDSTAILRMNVDRIDNTPEAAQRLLTDLRETMKHLDPKLERVVLSLENVEYIGLSTVGVLLEIHQGAHPHHHRFPPIAIADLQRQPQEKLHLTRLDTLIPTFATTAEAIADRGWPKPT